ncbi:uncharacterized protein LOC141620389 [Silene latifolia]|uniref:uncharacterized protein LOC141620389 n=1 Tax=Silene latifolia TaxID=37657 RepID=UPI003D788CE8
MDSIGCWNVRGINGINKQQDVRKFLHQNNIRLYGLVETKIKLQDFTAVLNNLGSHWSGVNNNSYHNGGRVWIIWSSQVFTVTTLLMNAQVITVKVTEIATGDVFILSVVYGFNEDTERGDLWAHLKLIKDTYSGPWGVCGDFNNVLNFNERIGRDVLWSEIADFRECVQYCGLTDIKGQGAFYTWNNKQDPLSRTFTRIDRFLINSEWLDLYPCSYAHFLPEGLFDHNPCVCYRRQIRTPPKRQFRYYNMWSLDEEFPRVVQQVWRRIVSGSFMYQVVTKLKQLKKPLRDLNKNKFSDVEKAVGVAQALLESIQIQIHATPTDTVLIAAECEAAESLRKLTTIQHSFLCQRAKID